MGRTPPARRMLNASIFLAALIALAAGYLVVSDILRRSYEAQLQSLLTSNLRNSERAIEQWVDTRTTEVLAHSIDPMLLSATRQLLPIRDDRQALIDSPAQEQLRTFFASSLYLRHVNGYFLISADGISLASSRDANIGSPNLLLDQPEVFERLLAGHTLLTPMERSDIPLSQNSDIRENLSNFAAAPLLGVDGSVVAILALRLSPKDELFQLLNFVEGTTDLTTYAFNRSGALLSQVDDIHMLRRLTQVKDGQDHYLYDSSILSGESALIHPVQNAINGVNGTNIQGYVSYAGQEKVGAWRFFDDLGFGIVIEQPKSSAYQMLAFFESLTLSAFGIGLIVVSGLFFWMLEVSKRMDSQRRRLVASLKATRDVNFQISTHGTILNANDALQSVFGLERRQGNGRTITEFLDFGDEVALPVNRTTLRSLVQATETTVLRCDGVRQDGTRFPVGIRVVALATDVKFADTYLVVVHDHSEIEQRETDLRDALERAEAGNRTKASFLSTISHELRSPLISVIAALELLTDRATSNEDRNLLDSSQRSAQLLLGIIDDILDYSRMEADKLELARQPVSLESILSDVVEMLRWQAWNNNVELLPHCDPGLPLVAADGIRLRQIFLNLTANAIKFSAQMRHPGKVSVAVSGQPMSGGKMAVTLTVKDNGIGMNAETVNQIFQPFTQADGSIRRKYGGTGLGLTISDRLIKMMGGHISVMSDPGKGTIFTASLTMTMQDQPTDPAPQPLEGCTVVVQSSNPVIEDQVQTYATWAGAKVLLARDVMMTPQDETPDILVMNAVGSTEAAKLIERFGPVPVLQIRNTGRDMKPTGTAQRVMALTSLLPQETVAELTKLKTGQAANNSLLELLPQSRVLLIEDDEMTREITLRMLKQMGITADAVGNGQEGLELWRSGHYTLLLSDCHMPIMDGFQMAAQIRSEEDAKDLPKTPIVAVSADITMEVERLCVDCEIDEYVPKPLTPAKLKNILRMHLGGKTKRMDA